MKQYKEDPRSAPFFIRYPSRRLNLGSGADIRTEFVNIDMHNYGLANTLVGNVMDLPTLPSGNFDEIVAQDVIEHIRWRDTISVFAEWNRLLAIGGTLYVRSTWLNGLSRLFERPEWQSVAGQFHLLTNLFSRQLTDGDFHNTAFTEILIRFYMWSCGFKVDNLSVLDGWVFELNAVKERDTFPEYLLDDSLDEVAFILSSCAEILGEQPSEQSLITLGQQLSGSTREAFLRSLFASDGSRAKLANEAPEFPSTMVPWVNPQTTAETVNNLYRAILGRDVDPEGLATWRHKIDVEGMEVLEVRRRLFTSQEFSAAQNGPSGWAPIGLAPTDGRRILVKGGRYARSDGSVIQQHFPSMVMWDGVEWVICDNEWPRAAIWQPTHWCEVTKPDE